MTAGAARGRVHTMTDKQTAVSVDVVADGSASGGDYALLDVRAEAGLVLPAHVLSREDLALYVLRGELEVVLAGRRHPLSAGAQLALPRGVPRRVRVLANARVLCLAVPSGCHALAVLLAPPIPERDDLAALLAAAGVTLLPAAWDPVAGDREPDRAWPPARP